VTEAGPFRRCVVTDGPRCGTFRSCVVTEGHVSTRDPRVQSGLQSGPGPMGHRSGNDTPSTHTRCIHPPYRASSMPMATRVTA